jgi:hypothetical protein
LDSRNLAGAAGCGLNNPAECIDQISPHPNTLAHLRPSRVARLAGFGQGHLGVWAETEKAFLTPMAIFHPPKLRSANRNVQKKAVGVGQLIGLGPGLGLAYLYVGQGHGDIVTRAFLNARRFYLNFAGRYGLSWNVGGPFSRPLISFKSDFIE